MLREQPAAAMLRLMIMTVLPRVGVVAALAIATACSGQSGRAARSCAFQDHAGGAQHTLRLTSSGSGNVRVKVGAGISLDFAGAGYVRNVSLTPGSTVLARGTQNGLRGDEYVFTVVNAGNAVVSAATTAGQVSGTVDASC